MIRALGVSLCLIVALGTSGCALKRSIKGPRVPSSLAIAQLDKTTVPKEITDFNNGCAADKTAGSSDQTLLLRCKLMRNRIVYDLKLIIDRNYEDYARAFEQTANTLDFGMEVSATTLSGVATIADTGIKDLLSLASTLTQSTEASTQKNFYQKQTAFTILAVMNSQRLDRWKDILQSMDNELDDYPLSAALADLAAYRMQGTAEAAFEAIQKNAGTTQDKAKAVIDKAKGINPDH